MLVAILATAVLTSLAVPQVRACLVDVANLLINGELPGGG
jgi:hypothetical protein